MERIPTQINLKTKTKVIVAWVALVSSCYCCLTVECFLFPSPSSFTSRTQLTYQQKRYYKQQQQQHHHDYRLRVVPSTEEHDDRNNKDDVDTEVINDSESESKTSVSQDDDDDEEMKESPMKQPPAVRRRVKQLAKSLLLKPLSLASSVPMPSAIAAVLREASLAAVEQVMEHETNNNNNNRIKKDRNNNVRKLRQDQYDEVDLDEDGVITTTNIEDIIDQAFQPMERSLQDMELSLQQARTSLQNAKEECYEAMQALQMAAMAQAEAAATTVAQVEQQVMAEWYNSDATTDTIDDISSLTFDDVDYESSEMTPPFLDFDSCLVPGEPVVRLERAPENSRRIFAGIDIMASVDDVWKVRRSMQLLSCLMSQQ
jgi:hypothetical protein